MYHVRKAATNIISLSVVHRTYYERRKRRRRRVKRKRGKERKKERESGGSTVNCGTSGLAPEDTYTARSRTPQAAGLSSPLSFSYSAIILCSLALLQDALDGS